MLADQVFEVLLKTIYCLPSISSTDTPAKIRVDNFNIIYIFSLRQVINFSLQNTTSFKDN